MAMTLIEFLRREKITPNAFARKLGWPASRIHRLVHDQVRPSVDTVLDIFDESDGRVGLESWRIGRRKNNGRRS